MLLSLFDDPLFYNNPVLSTARWKYSKQDGTWAMTVDLPGHDPQQMEVEYHDAVLTFRTGRDGKPKERYSVTVPDDTDPATIQVEAKFGVVTISGSRGAKESKRLLIPVKT
jgi:HSP20 family molecular chaperone IbpA